MSEAIPRGGVMLFSLGDEIQSISARCVARILPTPQLRAFPLMPQGVAGLVAVGGKVVPLIDLPVAEGGETVLVTIRGNDYAFRVDKALRLVGADDASNVEVRPLDLDHIVAYTRGNDLSADERLPDFDSTGLALSQGEISSVAPQSSALRAAVLVVETESARHLLPLSLVLELQESLPIVELPDPSPIFGGAAFYRDALIPVICLEALLGGERVDPSLWGAFAVAATEGRLCALAVKRVVGLSQDAEPKQIVDLKKLLDAAIPEAPGNYVSHRSHEMRAPAIETSYLLIEIGAQICAFPIAPVAHIHDSCRVIDTPAMASAIAGIAAIGDRVLPVLDVSRLLGLSATKANQFLELKTQQMGAFVIAIDTIVGIVPIAREAMLRAPEGAAISAIAKIDAKLVWILEPATIAERAGWSAHAA